MILLLGSDAYSPFRMDALKDAIAGRRGSHVCCLNGAAAHKGRVGDRLIVMAFAQMDEETARTWVPKVKRF